MTSALLDELRQRKPFASLAEEVHLSVGRTEAVLAEGVDAVLRPHEIGDRLITRMPDVTRLLDRMEESGLVTRERDTTDRRLVTTRLTERGRALVDSLDAPMAEAHARRFAHMDADQLGALVDLLALVRRRG